MVEEFISSPTCRMSSGFTVRDEVTDIDAEIRKKKAIHFLVALASNNEA